MIGAVRIAALSLTAVTGFAGLVYEVVWQKYVATLLGSHSEATAIVLGVFLAGLSMGYALFGSLTRRLVARAEETSRPPRLLLAYGSVEIAIGLYALAFPSVFEAVRELSYAMAHGSAGLSLAFDALLVAGLLGPPTLLMGGTIPMLTQALARSVEDSTRIHALVYGFNTIGAFAGALAAGFILIPWLGLVDTVRWMSSINLVAGVVFVAFGLRESGGVVNGLAEARTGRVQGLWTYSGVAFLLGFSLMVVQNVAIRLAGLSLGSSEFTFAIVVAVFVFSIAIGSLGVSLLPRVPRLALLVNQLALCVLLMLLYWPMQQSTYWGHVLRTQFGSDADDFRLFHLACFAALLSVLGLPAALAGATLPLLFDHLRTRFGDLGALAGGIYSWNTLGSLAGAILGGYALLFVLDLHHVYRLAVAAAVLAAALLWAKLQPTLSPVRLGAALVIALAVLAGLQPWPPEYLSLGLFRERTELPAGLRGIDAAVEHKFGNEAQGIIFYDDDPVASVAVLESPTGSGDISRAVLSNGKSDGATGSDYPTMALAGLIPALLAEKAERAFVIGYGTGVTVGELAALDSIQRVVTAEISPGVLAAAPLFDFANQQASRSPKLVTLRGDAYRTLMRGEDDLDIIVSEPSNPWVTGVEMLYSHEFLLAARSRLTRGGVYAQWYHQYETDEASVALVLRTFASVFHRVAVWYGLGADVLVMGFNDDAFTPTVSELRRRYERPDIRAGLRRAGIQHLEALLAHELIPVGVVSAGQTDGPIHSLYRPLLNHAAGIAFFRGAVGRLPRPTSVQELRVGAENSLLRQHLDSFVGAEREQVRARITREACIHRKDLCGSLLAEWMVDDPDSQELAEILRHSLSSGIRFGGRIRPRVIERLSRFYADPDPLGPPVSIAAANEASRLFLGYFQYAAQPDPQTLIALWRRCQESQEETRACARGLERAVRLTAESGHRMSRDE